MTEHPTITALKRELDEQVAPYLELARKRGDGVQIVLYVDKTGKVGRPKVTVTSGSPGI